MTTKAKSDNQFIQDMLSTINFVESYVDGFISSNSITISPWMFEGKDCTVKTPLKSLKRRAFNARSRLSELKDPIALNMCPKFLGRTLADQCEATQRLRSRAAGLYLLCDDIYRTIKACGGKSTNTGSEDVTPQRESQLNAARKLHQAAARIFHDLPDCGMTIREWQSYDKEDMSVLRTPGRPATPNEVLILRLERDLDALVELATIQTKGAVSSLDQLLEGVEQANQGRPQMSYLSKLDRRVSNCRSLLHKLVTTPANDGVNGPKLDRLITQIEDLDSQIEEEEAMLTGADKIRRDLDKVRAKHLQLSYAEPVTADEEKALIMMALMRNEVTQQHLATQLKALAPDERIALTHKVNPKGRLVRYDLILASEFLSEEEKGEAMKLNNEIEAFQSYRSR